ncbi:MAG TPA: LarC family nickel insertion protein, partial [Actinomycetota bacterium]
MALLYVDVIGGAAGDMLLAALLDAGAPLEEIREAIDAVVPGRFVLEIEEVHRGGLRSSKLRIVSEESDRAMGDAIESERSRSEARGAHQPGRFLDLIAALDRAPLRDPVRRRARAVLDRLGRAESRVHGAPLDALVLHELGDDDTLLDVVGVSAALDALGVDEMLVSSVPLGPVAPESSSAHVLTGVAGPAALEMLHGFRIRDGGSGETVTPTGAAILSALGRPTDAVPDTVVTAVGYGAGTRNPEEYPNVVRVVLGENVDAPSPDGIVVRDLRVIEANIDDMTPELVADAAEALLTSGAVDVWTMPIQMKKGRIGVLLSALCQPDRESTIVAGFFEHTTTFGLRISSVRRAELERRTVRVRVGDDVVRVKIGCFDGVVRTATPEHDDVA